MDVEPIHQSVRPVEETLGDVVAVVLTGLINWKRGKLVDVCHLIYRPLQGVCMALVSINLSIIKTLAALNAGGPATTHPHTLTHPQTSPSCHFSIVCPQTAVTRRGASKPFIIHSACHFMGCHLRLNQHFAATSAEINYCDILICTCAPLSSSTGINLKSQKLQKN